MKVEKTYFVTLDGVTSTGYKASELTWLWRTALPDQARYRYDSGEWRPVSELVEPIIAQEDAKTLNAFSHERKAVDRPPRKPRWPAIISGFVVVISILVGIKIARSVIEKPKEMNPQAVQHEVRDEAVQRENEIRLEDTIESRGVYPGMTEEQVRKSWGEPRGVEGLNDANQEMWRYKGYRVYFKSGVVNLLEPIR